MPVLARRQIGWNEKPGYPVRINKSHPLGRHVTLAQYFGLRTAYDSAADNNGTIAGGVTPRTVDDQGELSFDWDGSSGSKIDISSSAINIAKGTVVFDATSRATWPNPFYFWDNDGTNAFLLQRSGDNIRLFAGGALKTTWAHGQSSTSDYRWKLGITWPTNIIYENGVNVQDGTDSDLTGLSGDFIIGEVAAGGNNFKGPYKYLIAFDIELTATQIKSIHDNPYQLLEPRTIFIPLEVSSTNIDTKEKRAAVLGVARPWMRDKFPVATPDQEWRMSSGNTYGGNPLSPAVGGRIMSSVVGAGGLVHRGGLAGEGGGLAG